MSTNYRVVKGGVPRGGGSLIFPNVPQSSLGILQTNKRGEPKIDQQLYFVKKTQERKIQEI